MKHNVAHAYTPAPKHPMPKKRVAVFFGIMAVLLCVYFVFQMYYVSLIETPVDISDSSRIEFEVEKGSSAKLIASNLKSANLIRSSFAFKILVESAGIEGEFLAGRFVLRKDQSLEEIVQTLTTADALEVWITVLEGWRADEIGKYLEIKGYGSAEKFMECVENCSFTYDILADLPEDQSLEGYLFPDTYIIDPEAGVEKVVEKLVATMESKITEDMRLEISNRGKTVHEILTMASIIEREVRGTEERRIVSGILWKRFEAQMGLGADATVLYAHGDWKAVLTREALDIDSPYNTRKYRGLPPGPIASPSESSIMAAIYPEDSPYWYYLNTMDTGEVKYGRDLDEHNTNKAKYL